ncbi:sigma factor-like helix-turn-helix DNA-binding protein [Alistipes sp.]|uniref:sigma factor-like helix-turn-helix DNA-binding protein n=1 Tax=Alistipes sp. TaxID=1872444 RepID=UPI003AF181F6
MRSRPTKTDWQSYRRLEAEYARSAGVFDEDDPLIGCCRAALRALPEADRRVFVLYAELGSVRRLSEVLGVSKSTAHNRVCEIREKLLKHIHL